MLTNPVRNWLDVERLPAEAFREINISLKSEPLTVTVKPLPESGKPENFTGAVGVMYMEASLAGDPVALNSTGHFQIRIGGKGNLHLLTPPDIRWPDGLEGYEPKTTFMLDRTTVPVSGYLDIEYPFTARDTGSYVLPALSFSYFDPGQEKYISLQSAPLPFSVGPARQDELVQAGRGSPAPGMVSTFFSHRWWVVLVIAGIMLSGLLIWVWRDARKDQNLRATETAVNFSEPAPDVLKETSSVWESERAEATAAYESGDRVTYFQKSLQAFRRCSAPGVPAEEMQILISMIENRIYNPVPDDAGDCFLYEKIEKTWDANR
jgi:hypothetical protein